MGPPAVRQGFCCDRASNLTHIFEAKFFRHVQPSDLGDGYGIRVMAEQGQVIPCSNLTLPSHRQVKTRSPALEKALDHIVRPELNPEFVARKPWLGDYDFR